jgi:glycosyltransferase involved in cell wall biosynthesis
MKLLIATGIYPPDIGGPATYVKELGQELPKRGFDTTIITYAYETGRNKENGIDVIRVGRKQNIFLRYFCYFKWIIYLKKEFDIIFVQDPVSAGVPVWLASKITRKPYVLKVVGDYAWEQGTQRFGVQDTVDDFQKKKYVFVVEFMRWLQKRVAKSAKKIIVPSNYLKKIVSYWGDDTDKIKVIYNALDPICVKKIKEVIRKEKNMTGFVVVSIARLVPWKGFLTLIDAVKECRDGGKDVTLFIGGDGPERKKIQNYIEKLGLEKNIIMLGRLAHDDVLEYLKGADIFALNTQYEGLSHLLLEATMVGLPILTTHVGGNPEVVLDNVNGLLVLYNDTHAFVQKICEMYDTHFEYDHVKRDVLLQKFDKQKTRDQLVEELKNI